MALKVALIGSFWPASLEASYQRAFTSIGAEVLPVDFEKALANELGGRGPLRHLFGNRAALRASGQLESGIKRFAPDLTLVFKGTRIPPDFLERLGKHTVLANFNPDSPWERSNSSKWLIESIPLYHHHFTWSSVLMDRFSKHGARAVGHLPFAYDPELHSPVTERSTEFDVVFIGTYEPLRDATLTHLKHLNVAIWGNGWKRSKLVPKRWIKGAAIYGNEASHAMSRGVVNLNILREQNRGSHNMRTFEIPATANLMLTNRSAEQQQFFDEGTEILSYASAEEMIEQVRFALNRRDEAMRMGERSFERVRAETYAKRATEILHATGLA